MNEKQLMEYGNVVRDMIQHENTLTNNRLTWLFVAQGFLFNAAALFEKTDTAPFVVVALLGILTSISFFYSLWLSRYARKHLRDLWQERIEPYEELRKILPPVAGDNPKVAQMSMLNPWMFVPLVIIIAWTFLIIFSLLY